MFQKFEHKISDKKHQEWIKSKPCLLCDPNLPPRGPSDDHHTGYGLHTRRALPFRVPLCRHHHILITNEPYIESLLEFQKWGIRYYKIHCEELGVPYGDENEPGIIPEAQADFGT